MLEHTTLPPNWSQHVAPSGHVYYYNSITRESTYERPVQQQQQLQQKKRKRGKPPKPGARIEIPNARPWVLVAIAGSGRRFVYNPETKESLWVGPSHVENAINQLDRRLVVLLVAKARGLKLLPRDETLFQDGHHSAESKRDIVTEMRGVEDKGEKVVEKKKEQEQEIAREEEEQEEEEEEEGDQAPEFTEQDIEWQMQAMLHDQKDQFSYTRPGTVQDDLLSQQEAKDIVERIREFKQSLDDMNVNPYNLWDKELLKVINDERYTAVGSSKLRNHAFHEWARGKIHDKNNKDKDNKNNNNIDPETEMLQFISNNYKKSQYYIDFKRSHRKDPIFKNSPLSDREKEKIYQSFTDNYNFTPI